LPGGAAVLQGAAGLLEGLGEGPADGHDLPDRLHPGGQLWVGPGELLEVEPGHLDDHVVQGRLEGGGGLAGDLVADLVQGEADGQLGGHLGDREPGGLGGQGRGARHPRVHLDHDPAAGPGVDGELDVGPAGLDPDGPQHGEGVVAHLLVLAVGQGHLGGDGDRVAGVDAHRVDVLDRADDHDVVVAVAHHLELELAPAEHRLLDQHLVDRAGGEPLGNDLGELRLVVGHATAVSAERERRPDDDRKGELAGREGLLALLDRLDDLRERHPQPGLLHRGAEGLAVLGAVDRLVVSADQLDAEALENAVVVQRLGQVERGLAAQGREKGVRPLALDHLRDRAGEQRLYIGPVGELGVGHDRRRVRVDQHDLVALLQQHLARLHAGVVELGRLPDHDRPGSDQQDLLDVVTSGHLASPSRRRGPPRASRTR
jgi:hypothetical protein